LNDLKFKYYYCITDIVTLDIAHVIM